MSRRAALAAVARAVESGGDVDAAYAALGRFDPLVRRPARRLVRDAYVDALLCTQIKKGDAANRHVMRLGYLILAGAPAGPDAADDPDAVALLYDAARARHKEPRPRFWWPTALLVLSLAALGAAGSFTVYRLLHPPRFDASARAAPPPRGAFASGGKVAAMSPVLTQAFSSTLPDFLIALDRWSRAREEGAPQARLALGEGHVDEARQKLLGPEIRAALGPGASKRLEELLSAAKSAAVAPRPVRIPGVPDPSRAAGEPLMEATGAFDDELAAAGLGYFIDGDVITDLRTGHHLVILYSFTVESVTIFDSAGAKVRALDLRRLDHLNWTQTLLGFTRPHLREALVLMDQVDEQLVTYILPGLGKDAGIELFDDDPKEGGPGVSAATKTAVEGRAGELVRAEYGATPGLPTAKAERLGHLLSRRRALFDDFEKRVTARGMVLATPTKLRLDADYMTLLAGIAPKDELDELRSLDDEVGETAYLEAYARVRDVLVDSVERHEAQHRLDYSRPEVLPMPRVLEAMVGPAESDGEEHRFPAQARAELSAYLAELSRDDRTTRVGLTMISRFLFKRTLQGTAECYSAVVIFEGLCDELGIDRRGASFVRAGNVERERVAAAYLDLVGRSPAEIRGAAARLWEKLFSTKLPELRPAAAR